MTTLELYQAHYNDYCEFGCDERKSKYEWAASEVFGLTTYDSSLDELFVSAILGVMQVIRDRANFEFIKDEDAYILYIQVCQMLNRFNWIEWGTSIRGAWFEPYHPCCKPHPIVQFNLEKYGVNEIPATKENILALIEFLEEKEEPSNDS